MKKIVLIGALLLCALVTLGKEDVEDNLPTFMPPDSTGFNMIVNIGELNDTMMYANDQAFFFDASEVEVTDETGRFVLLSSLEPPATARLLVVEENGMPTVARIRVTTLTDQEGEERSLHELQTDNSKGGGKGQGPSGGAKYGTSRKTD